MRIISGMRRGLKLNAPEGFDTRPTTDRVKESVFNIIQFAVPCDECLDLFAGSGALGIEALSRGSEHCVFVDGDRRAGEVIKSNLSLANFLDKSDVIISDSLSYLDRCSREFDIIFLDPPYNKGFLEPVVQKIYEKQLLKNDGLIVIETERGGELPPDGFYTIRKTANYGKTTITILQR